MSLTQERMEHALKYLATTDEEFAKAKALVEGLKEQFKPIKASLFMRFKGSIGERENMALAHPDYDVHLKKYQNAVMDLEYLRAKRSTETLVIDCWRSLNSARGKGIIT